MDVYSIAQWLVYNEEAVKETLGESYEQARMLSNAEAIDLINARLLDLFADEHENFSEFDLFDDDRIKTVIERVYTKEFYYEH